MLQGSQVPNWMVIIYERQQRFNEQVANQMVNDLVKACNVVGAPAQLRVLPITKHRLYRNKHQSSARSYKMGVGRRQYLSGLSSLY